MMKQTITKTHKTITRGMNISLSAMLLLSSVQLSTADTSTETSGKTETKEVAKDGALNKAIKKAVQITEMGNLRMHIAMDETALNYRDEIQEILSDYDFRLTPDNDQLVDGAFIAGKAEAIMKAGTEKHADIFFVAKVQEKLKDETEGFYLYESKVTTQTFHAHTGELISVDTSKAKGKRNIDEDDAKASATMSALKESTKKTIVKAIGKAHKMLLHELTLLGVESETQALWIANYIQSYKEIYHVRRVSFDIPNQALTLEIIASPRSETFWRAWIDNMKNPNAKEAIALLKQEAAGKVTPGQWKAESSNYKANGEWRTNHKDWTNEK